jgi:hypothetical protein
MWQKMQPHVYISSIMCIIILPDTPKSVMTAAVKQMLKRSFFDQDKFLKQINLQERFTYKCTVVKQLDSLEDAI